MAGCMCRKSPRRLISDSWGTQRPIQGDRCINLERWRCKSVPDGGSRRGGGGRGPSDKYDHTVAVLWWARNP